MGLAERGKEGLKVSRPAVFAGIAIAAVVLAVVAGIMVAGSPNEARRQRFDQQRLDRVRGISYEVQSYYDLNGRLPEKLDELSSVKSGTPAVDPQTGTPIEYNKTGALNYELCAEFATVSPPISNMPAAAPVSVKASYDSEYFWRHGAGHHCFQIEVTKLTEPNQRKSCGDQAPCGPGYTC
ncbi:MAG: hypothetical protein PHT12_06230, partial [Patescibacteria group bacterium]|nr:hypothetical protein [Patescibacteria group bacterium]